MEEKSEEMMQGEEEGRRGKDEERFVGVVEWVGGVYVVW